MVEKNIKKFCKNIGVSLEATVGYQPEGNGIAERANRSIVESGNAMRHDSGIDERFWAEFYATAAYLRNREPIRVKNKTPEKL